ncbi:glycosyltransferase [Antribacter gilvus]|uniref:glycosyltransferase n=1 Tax=Antribacter gilvus TaxID=2304675 RepID=UPI000F7976E8|nr:glycosyltransferase [Antribacter gilvus]
MSVTHVLLTRFNLPSKGAEEVIRAKEGWLRDRVALFERYCLPSVAAQSDRDFAWLVYIDPQSPGWFQTWADDAGAGLFRAVRREEVPREALLADVVEVTRRVPERLLTTNLDNDDAVSVDFVERLRSAGAGAGAAGGPADGAAGRTAIYLENGLIRQGDRLYEHRDRSNAFCSVAEPWDGAVSCWADWHNRLELHMPALRLGGAPGWLQVVHGTNVSNRVRGRLASPAPYAGRFAAGLDGLPVPAARELASDRLVRSPLRTSREAARGLAKRSIELVGGRDAVDRMNAVRRSAVKAVTGR